MRDIAWRLGFSVIALTTLAFLGPSVSCGSSNRLIEAVTGQTPQARISRFMAAIAEGDRQAALDLWPAQNSSNSELAARREIVLDNLLACGPDVEHQILAIEWWRTCCEPGVIDDPRKAGGAHVRVAVRSENRFESIYFFDLLVPGGYWGSVMGNPVRRWAIVDVYPQDDVPLTVPWRVW